MSEVFQQTLAGKRRKATDKRAVETGGVENDGQRTICTWDVGIFPSRKKRNKEVSRAGRRRKAGKNTRSMAAGIASQRAPGTSEMLPCYGWQRTNDEERLHWLEDVTCGKYKVTFKEKMRASEWAFDRIKEAFELEAQDEAER